MSSISKPIVLMERSMLSLSDISRTGKVGQTRQEATWMGHVLLYRHGGVPCHDEQWWFGASAQQGVGLDACRRPTEDSGQCLRGHQRDAKGGVVQIQWVPSKRRSHSHGGNADANTMSDDAGET
eukprot:6476246-Amphidinium_carterae.3